MARVVRTLCRGLAAFVALYLLLCFSLWPLVLRPPRPLFPPPEDQEVVADFNRKGSCTTRRDAACTEENSSFFFGLATAPAHVEDNLNDSWLEYAQSSNSRVRAWKNIPLPAERLRFWSSPDVEIQLAKEGGSQVFRLGIDWGRIVPQEPVNGTAAVVDMEAVERYKWILQTVKANNMRTMVTLFHHSSPKWALAYGGWIDRRTVKYFEEFARLSKEHFGEYVDYWVTFNEPHIFVILSHCSGTWPPGIKPSLAELLLCFMPRWGHYGRAMASITEAHVAAYNALHEGTEKVVVGAAHHVGVIHPYGLLDIPVVFVSGLLTEFHWIDTIQGHLDYCGINYYGQEILSAAGLILVPEEEYSEAGRGVYPDGLFEVLVKFHERYKAKQPNLRYIVTENGLADASDNIRRPYIVEHLLAINAAIQQGIPVDGYLHWTISDNWEWADGYCPKFGLVDVERSNDLTRVPRPSYYLYQKISKSGIITREQREGEWQTLQEEMKKGALRPFCRASAPDKRMWDESVDMPGTRAIASTDWRFTKYTLPSLSEYAKRSVEVAGILVKIFVHLLSGGSLMEVSLPPELVIGEL